MSEKDAIHNRYYRDERGQIEEFSSYMKFVNGKDPINTRDIYDFAKRNVVRINKGANTFYLVKTIDGDGRVVYERKAKNVDSAVWTC